MKVTMLISTVLCLLLVCAPAAAQGAATELLLEDTPGRVPELPLATPAVPSILSAIPADAYGFIATNNLQASYDNVMLFGQALGVPIPSDNKLLAIQEHIGEIDLDAPAAVILLDPQRFPDEPIALLFSAADAQGIFKAHLEKTQDTDEQLPPGVAKGADGYLAVKNGFVVFAPQAELAAAVLAEQAPLQIMPAAKEAFDKGQIVLAGDLQQAAPWLIQKLIAAQSQMIVQMDAASTVQMGMANKDMFSLCVELASDLLKQTDKLTLALDINAEQAVLTKRVLFKADSAAATLMNAHIGLPAPTYTALPGGPFLLAGASSIDPEQLSSLAETVMTKFFELPTFKDKLSAEHAAQMIADSKASSALSSSSAFIVNLGSPMTGMINAVGRYDVSDSATYKEHAAKMYQAEYMSAYTKAFGGPGMEFVYTSAAESYSDVDIDTVKMEITPPEPPAEDDPMAQQKQMMMAQQMQMLPMLYGPDMTFRMAAPNEKQVLFVMGGSGRMERAINVAQGHGSVLADDPKIIQAAAKLPANRFAEAHLDLGQLVPMIGMFTAMAGGPRPTTPAGQAPAAPPISFSTSAETNTLRADMVVPSKTIGTLISSFMAMQGGGPGVAPAEPSEEFEEGDF